MDSFTLGKLEFDQVRRILSRFCRCRLGVALARRITPSRSPETIRHWLAQTREMTAALIAVGPPPFGGITDISDALGRAAPGRGAGGEDFAAIAATLEGCGAVRQWLAALAEDNPLLRTMGESLAAFDGEVRAIRAVVDSRGEVMDSASQRLASIRGEIDSCQLQIREVVYSFVRRRDVAQYLQSTTVQMHEERFVLPLKAEHQGRLPGLIHRTSHTGATLFVEPAACVQLNNRLVALQDKQREEIARLLSQLTLRVHAREREMRQSLRVLAQVDLVVGKAQYAYQFEMTCPEVTERGPLQFHQARHPLLIEQAHQQELAGVPPEQRHPVVPIDVRLGSDFDLLIVTGSNTGGKTVALKTVGLMVLMAQSGMFIPAQRGAVEPAFRDVLLDVGDEQSLQQSLSTFGGHLRRIKRILRSAGRYSLVLLDELGSGTDPEEGGAIGQAVLDELRHVGCLGMVSTHLGVLKAYAYTHDRVDNASVDFDTKTLKPTYRLLIGQPGESHAIIVAEHYGLPKRLTRAARGHLGSRGKQFRKAIRATLASRQASETARSEAQTAKVEAQSSHEAYQEKLAQLEGLSTQFADWLSTLPVMQAGDEVFVRRFGKTGRLVRLQLSRQLAVVDIDSLQVEVPLQELMPDLADPSGREEVVSLRKQIARQAEETAATKAEVERTKAEYHQSLSMLRGRQRHFDAWCSAIRRLAVGQVVTFDSPPGRGKVVAMDLPSGRVTVETPKGKLELPLQQLFPEAAGFGRQGARHGKGHGKAGAAGAGRKAAGAGRRPAGAEREPANKPVERRSADSRQARINREILLKLPPRSQVYVVPFHKRATLLRVDPQKNVATVQAGAFEMQIPLADLEPIDKPPAPAAEPKPPSA